MNFDSGRILPNMGGQPKPLLLNHSFPRDVSSRFGRRLKELRRSHKLTQTAMAKRFGIDRSFISDVERGQKSVSLPTLEVMALGFKISLSDILRGV